MPDVIATSAARVPQKIFTCQSPQLGVRVLLVWNLRSTARLSTHGCRKDTIYHLTPPKNNVSALELKRLLGVSYKAACRMKHKLLQVMMDERDAPRILGERVEVDDAYLSRTHPGKVGRGAHGKVTFVIAVQTITEESQPRNVRLDPVPGFTKKALTEWADRFLARIIPRLLRPCSLMTAQPEK